jgi:CubicO group peptidase (beta-lactamase class C family)
VFLSIISKLNMQPLLQLIAVSLIHISLAFAGFLGPSYTSPKDLSSNSSFIVAGWKNFTSVLQTKFLNGDDQTLNSSTSVIGAELRNFTFSVGMFSLNDPRAIELQFHYTSPEIANSTNGTHEVDGDSIYRIASVTKVFTVLAGLLELTPNDWERPLTDIYPILADFAQRYPGEDSPTDIVEWDQITLSSLASQISGVPRDSFGLGEILVQLIVPTLSGQPMGEATKLGLPPVNQSDPLEFPPCVSFLLNSTTGICPLDPSIETFSNRPPTFQPWTSPAYSDIGFALLGQAISNITGKSLDDLYREKIFEPLGMDSSNSTTPPTSEWFRAVIPGETHNFDFEAGIFVSSGGLASTPNDLAKLGVGILNSTLLSSYQTRKWLKPHTHTARLQYSVGAPWYVIR